MDWLLLKKRRKRNKKKVLNEGHFFWDGCYDHKHLLQGFDGKESETSTENEEGKDRKTKDRERKTQVS